MGLGQAYLKHVPANVPPLDPYPDPLWTLIGLGQTYLKHLPPNVSSFGSLSRTSRDPYVVKPGLSQTCSPKCTPIGSLSGTSRDRYGVWPDLLPPFGSLSRTSMDPDGVKPGLSQACAPNVLPLDLYPEPLWTPLGFRCTIRGMEGMIFGLA